MKKERDIFSGLGETTPKEDGGQVVEDGSELTIEMLDNENVEKQNSDTTTSDNAMKERHAYIEQSINRINIIPLRGDLKSITNKKKYKNLFHQVHLSQQSAHFLGKSFLREIVRVSDEDATCKSTVSVETGRFIFPLSEEKRNEMNSTIINMGSSNHFTHIGFGEVGSDSADRIRDMSSVSFTML